MAHIEMTRDEFVSYLAENGIHVKKITPTRVYLNFEVDTSKCDPLLDPDRHLCGKPLYGGQKADDGRTLRDIINGSHKVEAIKAVRTLSGVSLQEAKDIVEANM